jgi:hypothetical protein
MEVHQIKKLLRSKGNNCQESEDSLQNGRKSLPATHWIRN